MGQADKKRLEDPLLDLTIVLEKISNSSKDRLECYRELVDNEWIPEDMFKRLVENERLGLINEVDRIMDYFRGSH